MKIEVNIKKRHVFTLIGIILLLGVVVYVKAAAQDTSVFHGVNQIDWSKNIQSNIIIIRESSADIRLASTDSSSSGYSTISFQKNSGTSQVNVASIGVKGGTDRLLRFAVASNSGPPGILDNNVRVVIDGITGRVGIGTLTPNSLLDVNGSVQSNGINVNGDINANGDSQSNGLKIGNA